jgi:hypothetical protein
VQFISKHFSVIQFVHLKLGIEKQKRQRQFEQQRISVQGAECFRFHLPFVVRQPQRRVVCQCLPLLLGIALDIAVDFVVKKFVRLNIGVGKL